MANRTTDPQLAIVGDLPDNQYDAMVDIYAKMVIYHLHHTQDEITHSAQWQQWQTQLAAIHPSLTYSLIDRFRQTYAPDTQPQTEIQNLSNPDKFNKNNL
ncbi:MAG: hypothetical protein UH103_04030 [Paludibacteraceae bacterium]|nr:hypothetical protein [Paludibacteraceae bacterium]